MVMTNEEKARMPIETGRPVEVVKVPEMPKETPIIEVPEHPPAEKELPTAAVPISAPATPPTPVLDDPVLKQIETVLAEDLEQVYNELPPELKPKFKAKGEEAARVIRTMMETAKVKARKVLKLIVEWLKIIPGVNKFFLEQEATIKAQKIIAMAQKSKNK